MPCACAGIAKAVAAGLGKEANILLYDPAALGLGSGGKAEGFPFRCVGLATGAAIMAQQLTA